MLLEVFLQMMNEPRRPRRARAMRKRRAVNVADVQVDKERLGDNPAARGRAIGIAGQVKARMAQRVEHMCPLGRFERYAVGSFEARGNKADAMASEHGPREAHFNTPGNTISFHAPFSGIMLRK